MTDLLTSAQMRAIEAAAMECGEATGAQMMERAGRGMVTAMRRTWPDLGRARAVVLCGPGNNGGDGYVIARRLGDLGWRVEVFGLGDPARLDGDAAMMRALWDGPVGALTDAGQGEAADVVVDALFGTGLSRRVGAEVLAAREAALARGGARARLVAVDCLSGLDADSGRMLAEDGVTVTGADLTVTFHAAKLGHHLARGPELSGRLEVASIGLDGRDCPEAAQLLDGPLLALGKAGAGHKYDSGHAVIVAGPAFRTGAARLAARGALRIGAGLVTLAAPKGALPECAAQTTAIMLAEAGTAKALSDLVQDTRLNALCVGPGLGVDRAAALVRAAAGPGRALVLDADALTAFAEAPGDLFAALEGCAGAVLTPHMGEFARVFPDLARDSTLSKVDMARAAASRAGAVVLLKGPDTVIAAPGGRAAVMSGGYGQGAPWLATAGSGDVLAGIITGLLARGGAPFEAAATGAFVHRAAARAFGPGLIAEDLPEMLPQVMRGLIAD
ncbi:NAD(P)H-hydrate dehydratase [Anianabacter salinae]|uniref:NAD(P)H-hydrate dehydratase n=1 Tax=Anianabacter salinae TaxID=2851023 RepID=UPI00225DD5F0|nr:NAD(P)H-hydrate dehydratase [Anianabacter salinae]MBV0912925.1 NAD(P)H-hydrate dehydratase [Anianabacter salinae]